MHIDSSTVLLSGIFVKALIVALFLVFWIYDRRSTWFGWWGGGFAFGAVAGVIFLLRGFGGTVLSIGTGVAALIVAMCFAWQGARAFHRRRPLWIPTLLAPSVWLLACLVPGFAGNLRYRIILSSILLSVLVAMAAVEFWRDREERLLSRWPTVGVLASLSLFFAARIPLMDFLPFPFGALPERPGALAAFNLIAFAHSLVLIVLMVSISKERLELEQRTNAQTDPLTGALNRRAFGLRGGRLLSRHKYESAPLTLLFLDIDHFKSINDRLGHAGGDLALIKFVAAVEDNIRPTDFLFRIGGEEFCCLLPRTTTEQARRVAERIRRHFETATVDVAGTPVKTTVSLGIASTDVFGYDIDVLMKRADMAVYAAKRQGRNRVVIAEPTIKEDLPLAVDSSGIAAAT
jgi:diguanylate cyclase (GGDEF)-like protein